MQGGYYQSYQNGFLGSPSSVVAGGGVGLMGYSPSGPLTVGMSPNTPPYQHKNIRMHQHQRSASSGDAISELSIGSFEELTWEEIYTCYHQFNTVDVEGKGSLISFQQLMTYISCIYPGVTPPTSQYLLSMNILFPNSGISTALPTLCLTFKQLLYAFSHAKSLINSPSPNSSSKRKFSPQQAFHIIEVYHSVRDKTGGVPAQNLARFGGDRTKLPNYTIPFDQFIRFIGENFMPFESIFFSELQIHAKLGEGTFGVVYKGAWRGSTVAIKQIKINEDVTNQVLDEFRKELTILSKLRHPNIVLLMAACTQPPNLCFVTEFLNGGSLYDTLHSKKIRMNMPLYKKLAQQIAQGMNYLHLSGVIHRDIKSLNLLLDENMNVKICDFGLSRLKSKSTAMTKSIGSPIWMAPELLVGEDYTEKVDVYAFGIILWELGTGELPYSGLDSVQLALAVATHTNIMAQSTFDTYSILLAPRAINETIIRSNSVPIGKDT
eukprot:gene11935-13910_t